MSFLLSVLTSIVASCSEPSVTITHSARVVGQSADGSSHERIIYHGVDARAGADLRLDIVVRDQAWAGGRVTSTNGPVSREFENQMLSTVATQVAHPEVNNSSFRAAPRLAAPPATKLETIEGRYGPSLSISAEFYVDQNRSANQNRLSQYHSERLNSVQWSAREHEAQQSYARESSRTATREAMGRMSSDLEAKRDQNAAQRADLFYIAYLAANAPKREVEPTLTNERVTDIALTDEGRRVYTEGFNSTDGDWSARARYASLLANPWTGVEADRRKALDLDGEGVLKGPAFKPGSVAVNRLALSDPELAYRLLESANQLQALTASKPYLRAQGRARAVVDAAALMMRSATFTQSERQVEISRALVAYFTGHADQTRYGIEEVNGIFQFKAGADMGQGLNGAGAENAVAKAVYNELATDLRWTQSLGESMEEERSWGPAIPVRKAIRKFIDGTVPNRSTARNLDQAYPIGDLPTGTHYTGVGRFIDADLRALRTSPMAQGSIAASSAYTALNIAAIARASGDIESAEEWERTARMLADFALGFVPVVGTALDAYSLVTGYNLITGEQLTPNERMLAAVGLITAGLGSTVIKSVRSIRMIEKADKTALGLSRFPRTLMKSIHEVEVLSADHLNQELIKMGLKAAYKPGSRVYKFFLPHDAAGIFARVHGPDNALGRWFFEKKALDSILHDGDLLAKKLALKHIPTHITDFNPPAGVWMLKSVANGHILRGNGQHTVQYQILGQLSEEWFKNTRAIGHVKF